MSTTNNNVNNAIHEISQGCVNAAHHLIVIAGGLDRLPQYLEQFQGPPRKRTRKPRSPDMPKLPKSAYLLYSMEHRSEAREETDRGKASDVVTLLAQKWQALSPEEKEPYTVKAMHEKQRYEKEMMVYKATHPAANDQAEGSVATNNNEDDDQDDDSSHNEDEDEDEEAMPHKEDEDEDHKAMSHNDHDDESDLSSDDDDVPIKNDISDTESSDDSDTSTSIVLAPRVPQKHKIPNHTVTKQKDTIIKPKDAMTNRKNAAVELKENITKPKPKEPVKSTVKQSSMKNSDKSPKDKGKQPMIKKNNVKQNDKNKQTIMDKKTGQIQTAKQGNIKKKFDKSAEKGKQPMNVMKKRPSSSTNVQQPSKKAKKSKMNKALKLA